MDMLKFRILIGTSLICIAAVLFSTSMFGLTAAQEKAKGRCSTRYYSCIDACANKTGDNKVWCERDCMRAYNGCMDDAGIPLEGNPPPRLPRPTPGPAKSPPGSPSKKPPGPTLGPIKSTPTPSPTGPTILSRPSKPTPTPHKEHHHHP